MTRFITFEGGEGAGKSTQIAWLSQSMEQANLEHVLTREPGGSEGAEAIRDLLVTGATDRWDPMTESALFIAARHDHMVKLIQPALAHDKWVLCDRFMDSTRIYQGIGKQVDPGWLEKLYAHLCGSFEPDLTLLLDIDPEIGLKRTQSRSGVEARFESMDLSFHHTVREGFLGLATRYTQRFEIIDASQDAASVHRAIIDAVSKRFDISLTPVAEAA